METKLSSSKKPERDSKGRLAPGQKSLNPHGRPKKIQISEEDLEDIFGDELSSYKAMQLLLAKAQKEKNYSEIKEISTKLLPYQAARLASKQGEDDRINEIKIIVEIGNVELSREDPLFDEVTRSKFEDEQSEEAEDRSNTLRSKKVSDDSAHDEEVL